MAISLDCNSFAVHALVQGAIDRVAGGQLERIAAGIFRESVIANFAFGGRPAWAALKHRKGSPLIKTGRLKNSIYSRSGPGAAYVYTTVKYAPTHQFGARQGQYGRSKRGGPIPWGDVPARPSFVVQEEDVKKNQTEQARFIERGA